jgi:group I intron endonuclease
MTGIYCVKNNINGKRYIGQSWDIEARCKKYGHNSHNEHLERSISKYGIENFSITCLEEVDINEETQERLDNLECIYIKIYDTMNESKGYNKRDGGAYGRLTEETKSRISKTMKGKTSPLIGYKQTKEHIEHSRQGNIGKITKEETKLKISQKLMGRISPMKGKKQTKEHIEQRTKKMIITKLSKRNIK